MLSHTTADAPAAAESLIFQDHHIDFQRRLLVFDRRLNWSVRTSLGSSSGDMCFWHSSCMHKSIRSFERRAGAGRGVGSWRKTLGHGRRRRVDSLGERSLRANPVYLRDSFSCFPQAAGGRVHGLHCTIIYGPLAFDHCDVVSKPRPPGSTVSHHIVVGSRLAGMLSLESDASAQQER